MYVKFLQDSALNGKPFFSKNGFKLFVIFVLNFNLSVKLLVFVVCNDISVYFSLVKF